MSVFLVLAASIFTGAAAAAPPDRSGDSSAIVVEGVKNRDQQIRQFIRQLTPAPTRGQLGRFEMPVCPTVLGIAEAQADVVANRMRTVAKAAGIPVARPGCITNIAPNMPREFQIAVVWQGLTPTAVPGATDCGAGSYGDEKTRRAVTANIIIGCLQNNLATGLCTTP